MRHEMMGGDTFPIMKCYLEKGESIRAESGAMVSMSSRASPPTGVSS